MKVIHLNVRLAEGGAASVAEKLHVGLREQAQHESRFLYGYSKGGLPSKFEKRLHGEMITDRYRAYLNKALFSLLNVDVIAPAKLEVIREGFEWADIIHLHVVHSFFVPFHALVKLIVDSGKPVVWTQHDSWLITGRCAFTDDCTNWRSGCQKCPKLSNYPPVTIDRASTVFPEKRRLAQALFNQQCILVSPSEHLCGNIKEAFPTQDIRVIGNGNHLAGMVDPRGISSKASIKDRVRVLVVAHDLAYEGKTDRLYINKLRELVGFELHAVGKNSPFFGDDVINHGYVADAVELRGIVEKMDLMLFTSTVDNFPLVIGESLVQGVPVIASPSSAAAELLGKVDAQVAEDLHKLARSIQNRSWMADYYSGVNASEMQRRAVAYFSVERMLLEYTGIYEELL